MAIAYVESVLTEWHEKFRGKPIGEADARERTFWSALYQFEELAELAGCPHDPYEDILRQNLADVREMLRNREPLPAQRFMATRPDGT